MQRVFSEQNIARYKKLASGTLTADERKLILDLLSRRTRPAALLGNGEELRNGLIVSTTALVGGLVISRVVLPLSTILFPLELGASKALTGVTLRVVQCC